MAHQIPTIQIDRDRHCETCDARGVLPAYGKCMGCLEEESKSGNKRVADHLPEFWPLPFEIREIAERLISDHHEESSGGVYSLGDDIELEIPEWLAEQKGLI